MAVLFPFKDLMLNLGPGFLVETLDMATRYIYTEQHSESAKNGCHLNI